MNYTKELINLIDYVEQLVDDNNERKRILEMALKCKTDNEKINLLDNFPPHDGNSRVIDDLMLDNCRSNNDDFIDENDLNKHEYLFQEYLTEAYWFEWQAKYKGDDIEYQKRISKSKSYFYELKAIFAKAYPNGDELIKRYKLNEFYFWYDKNYGAYQEKIDETEKEILKEKEVIKQWKKELNGELSQEEKELKAKQEGKSFLKDTTFGGEVRTYFAN